jgi:hypothetical protein
VREGELMKIGFPAGGWALRIDGRTAADFTAESCEIDNDALRFFEPAGKAWESSIAAITAVRISTPEDSPGARERPTIPHGPHVVEISFDDGTRASLACHGGSDMESLTAARRLRKVILDARQR